MCFGDVYHSNGKLSTGAKCQSCVILRKPCKGGVRGSHGPSTASTSLPSDTVHVRPPVVKAPQPRRKALKSPVVPLPGGAGPSSSGVSPDVGGASVGNFSTLPSVRFPNPSVARKRSALAPPTSAAPSSSKVLRSSQSSSGIRRTSSAFSSSSSLPSPLSFSTSLPSHLSAAPPVLPARMVIDPPEDQIMVLIDALEFAIERGNLDDARTRIRVLRRLRRQEKGYPGV
jgi:hypothetical protein